MKVINIFSYLSVITKLSKTIHYVEKNNSISGFPSQFKNCTFDSAPTHMKEKMKAPEFLRDVHVIFDQEIEYENKIVYVFVKSEILGRI